MSELRGDCISRAVAIDAINHIVIKFPGLLTRKQQTTAIGTMTLVKNAVENVLIKLPPVKSERLIKYDDNDPKTWPEDGTFGLWQHKSGAFNVLRWKQDAQNHFYPDPYMWNIEDVVAWMPLPEQYKGESEDTSNLCNRCNNERCVMQSGIVRKNCDFFIAKESEE